MQSNAFTQILFPLVFAFLVTLFSTPFTIRLAKKFKLLDDPKNRPHPAHIQGRIIPRGGGLPIFIGLLFSILLFIPMDKHIIGIVVGIIILLITGLADDYFRNFSPYPRLLVQIIASLVVVASGVGISYVTNPFAPGVIRLDQLVYPIELFGSHRIIPIADLFALFWIVWMMNMINWAKGVDGQMPGITTVAGLTIGLLSFKLYAAGDQNQLYIAILSFITAGTSLGFLFFNWHPSKILPGFSASTILGFMIATLSVLSGAKLATALLVLLVPSIDSIYTASRRILEGHLPFYGDDKHLHHLLLKRGWSHQTISLFYITSCAILGLLATSLTSQGKIFTVVGVGTSVVGLIIWLHLLYRQKDKLKKKPLV